MRVALNWGDVKTGPDGDVLGKEVHRVCRIEGVGIQARVEPAEPVEAFPIVDRILITAEGLAQLHPTERERFRPVGAFHLKGFDELCQLWIYA